MRKKSKKTGLNQLSKDAPVVTNQPHTVAQEEYDDFWIDHLMSCAGPGPESDDSMPSTLQPDNGDGMDDGPTDSEALAIFDEVSPEYAALLRRVQAEQRAKQEPISDSDLNRLLDFAEAGDEAAKQKILASKINERLLTDDTMRRLCPWLEIDPADLLVFIKEGIRSSLKKKDS